MKTFKSIISKNQNKLVQRIKILTIISLIQILYIEAFSQDHLKLTVQTVAATCQANGEIHCTLTDTAGQFLEQIKYYYMSQDGQDSIMETSLPDIAQLKPGVYKVKVSALRRTGLLQEDAYTIVSDSITDIIIASDYRVPNSGIIYNLYNFHAPYGIVSSLNCQNTGKVQVQLEGGVFPYTIDIWKITKEGSSYLKSITFDAPQGEGTAPYQFDYQNYYTIDSLGIGDYQILCHDGCGYYMPSMMVTVPKVKFSTHKKSILLRNSPLNELDSNIVIFKTNYQEQDFLNSTDYYYLSHTGFEYRFINPTLNGSQDYSDWATLPDASISNTLIADTIKGMRNYGEIWGKRILFQIRPILCPDTVFEWPFTIYPEGNIYTNHTIYGKAIRNIPGYRDECGYRTNDYEGDQYCGNISHTRLTYNCADSIGCWNKYGYSYQGMITSTHIGMTIHHYVTMPLRYKVYNITQNRIITSGTSTYDRQPWLIYYIIDEQYEGDSLITELTDAHGCPIETYRFKYQYHLGHLVDPPHIYNNEWRPSQITNDCVCPGCEQSIGLYQYNGLTTLYNHNGISSSTYSFDTIRLISSPNHNFYNFKASSGTLQQWDVFRENERNNATIIYEDYVVSPTLSYPAIRITDTNLLDGDYVFVIDYTCDRNPDTITIHKQDYKVPEISEAAIYDLDTTCSRLDITPTAGSMTLNGKSLKTYFQYFTDENNVHTINAIEKGGSLSIGTSGDYRLAMYALPDNDASRLSFNPCYVKDTIIHWDGNNIEFDFLLSYVCNANDEEGFVRAQGKKGTLPYRYRVYSEPDGQGILLGENSTGDFEHLPIHFQQSLSIEMIDNCNAHFLTNFTVSDMEAIRKGWTENNLNQITLCEGEECHLYGLSLPEASYHWTGPNGFLDHRQNTSFLIGRDCPCAGTYRLIIDGTGCGPVQDSVQIDILKAPEVTLTSKSTFCLGEEAQIFATPAGVAPISYTLRLIDYEQDLVFSGRKSGGFDTIPVGENTAVQVLAIEDNRCRYELPGEVYPLHFTKAFPQETILEKTIHYEELPYLWNEHLFIQEETFTTTYTSKAGCDSTVKQILHVILPRICPTATDYDGYEYQSVLIDGRCWLQENLRSRHYSDGRAIEDCHPYYSDQHNDTLDNEEKFGLLYNYTATIDPGNIEKTQQGACPEGWLLPTISEYEQLFLHDFKALRSDRYWLEGRGGNNSTGFSALPAGFFNHMTNRYENLLGETRFWAQNSYSNSENILVFVQKDDCLLQIAENKGSLNRYSIRCILDE